MVKECYKKIKVILDKEPTKLPEELKMKIADFWKEQQENNTNLFDGDIFYVTKLEELEDTVNINVKKTKYSHYLYDERVGIPDNQYQCNNLSGGILLETLDGYYVVGEMDKTTSYPEGLQISGGNIDITDIQEDEVDIMQTITRELAEELDLDLKDTQKIKKTSISYIGMPEGNVRGYQIMIKAYIKMTKEEMEKHFVEYKQYLQENHGEIEFSKMHFIPKTYAKEILQNKKNPRRQYLEPLLVLDSKKEKQKKQGEKENERSNNL